MNAILTHCISFTGPLSNNSYIPLGMVSRIKNHSCHFLVSDFFVGVSSWAYILPKCFSLDLYFGEGIILRWNSGLYKACPISHSVKAKALHLESQKRRYTQYTR